MDKRTLLFIVLSVLVFYLWAQFTQSKQKTQPKPSGPDVTETEPFQSAPSESGPELKPITVLSPTDFTHPEVFLQHDLVIENELFKAIFTNKGAALVSLIMKDYQARTHPLNERGPPGNLRLIDTLKPDQYSFILEDVGTELLGQTNWKVALFDSQSITFQYQRPDGLLIKKTFTCLPDSYGLEYKVVLQNKSDQLIESQFIIGGPAGISPESDDRSDLICVRAYQDTQKEWEVKDEITLMKLESKYKEKGYQLLIRGTENDPNVAWTGLVNRYFATVLIPSQPEDIIEYNFALCDEERKQATEETEPNQDIPPPHNINLYLKTKQISIAPGETKTQDFLLFAGPKEKTELAKFSRLGIDKLISYGIFGFISKIILGILNICYGLFKNYGVAIIVLTIIIKLVLFPLTKKGQISMRKMQQLQPKIKALQERYKKDKQRVGVEQLKLFKEHGVNPLSGCLPMIFQIPVFIGLWRALFISITLRQAPFMLWITDLSQPDKLCKLPFPILGATDLHVLPLLMTASWFIQSLTQPKSPDPQQQQTMKIMKYMPLFFLLVLYNMPAGLTLYWLFSTLIGIIEQQIIKRVYFK